jgi:hypothetical protein
MTTLDDKRAQECADAFKPLADAARDGHGAYLRAIADAIDLGLRLAEPSVQREEARDAR